MVARAGTILMPSGPSHDPGKKHLFIVCTHPCAKGEQLIVSVASWVNNLCDDACILQPHEHDFLTQKSYILYRKARIEIATLLEDGLARKLFIAKPAMNPQSFLRIRNGICTSTQTPRKIKTYAACA